MTTRNNRPGSTSDSTIPSAVDMPGCNCSKKIVINELLSYISFYRNKGNRDSLQNIVLTHFPGTDISVAKKLLMDEFSSYLTDSSVLTERRTTSSRAAHEVELEDIFGALDLLDLKNILGNCLFVALNLDLLPKYGPEDINSGFSVYNKSQLQQEVGSQIDKLSGDISQLKQKVDDLTASVNGQLTTLNTHRAVDCVTIPARQTLNVRSDVDRSMNLIVFGVDENRNAELWRDKIDDVLHFVTSRQIDVVDMYRIGRHVPNKCRPVLVKLRTVWDRRIVLNGCSKLKNYHERVFVYPDEPPDVRRKRV